MTVKDEILADIADGPLHFTLIDPASTSPKVSADKARAAEEAGTSAIMVGGSREVTPESLDVAIATMQEAVDLPFILFPNGAKTGISGKADAIFFMSLLNSRDPRFLVREQVEGAPVIRELDLEPIPMGYVVVEPGMTVGEVGQADLVPRDEPDQAAAYGLCAQYFGMALVYLEAGSGAPEPVPIPLVKATAEAIDVPLVVGGGIRQPEQARALTEAGADVLVTGTLVEEVDDVEGRVAPVVDALGG